jgi:hypothetical protein
MCSKPRAKASSFLLNDSLERTAMQTTEISEYSITGLEAMLAGTFALMSAYAHCQCGNSQGLMSLKIISNLTCLQHQNSLSPEFRSVLGKVMDSWRQHSLLNSPEQTDIKTQAQAKLWHAAPSAMQ